MQALKEILVVLDADARVHPAIEKAAAIAAGCGARLRLFCCDHDPRLVARLFLSPESLSAARVAFLRRRREWLEGLAAPLVARGLAVEVEAAWDAPLNDGVLREVGLARPDLVVKDTAWHGTIRRALFTAPDWQLARTCPVPLLLVKPAPWGAPFRVAAAVDPGHPDDTASVLDHTILRSAAALGRWLSGRVSVVHAFLPLDPVLAAQGGPDIREAAAAALRTLLEPHDVPPGDVSLVEGAATQALPEYCAAHGIDVMVVGALSRSRLQEAVVGSTAERLLDRVPSDLLIVRARPAG